MVFVLPALPVGRSGNAAGPALRSYAECGIEGKVFHHAPRLATFSGGEVICREQVCDGRTPFLDEPREALRLHVAARLHLYRHYARLPVLEDEVDFAVPDLLAGHPVERGDSVGAGPA